MAIITKLHRLGGLNSEHVFVTVIEVEKYKLKVPADLVPDEAPLPGF